MYPHERSLVKNLAGKPFAIIGVNSDRDIEIPQKLIEEGTVTWRSFQNEGPEVPISETWGVRGWPTIYVLDAEGKIRYKNVRGDGLDKAVKTLMEEMGEEWPEFDHEEEEARERERKEKAKKKAKAGEEASDDDGDDEEQSGERRKKKKAKSSDKN